MSDRGRVVLIFVAVAALAGGAGFYFFKIHQPAQQLADAQAELATWEARYQEARGCLLGKTPGSTKTSEALAIREMAPDPWDRGRCTPLVSKLTRGEANDTGVEAVEAAWAELDKAAQQAALAFAKHVAATTTLADDPLPRALDDLDAARGKLRAAAQLPAATVTGTALTPAELVSLTDGAEAVTAVFDSGLPSAHGAVAFGRTKSAEVQIVLAPGGAPKVARLGPSAMRALPDLTWGASAGRLVTRGTGKAQDMTGNVAVGAMDAEGAIASPTTLTLTTPLPATGGLFGSQPGQDAGSLVVAAVAGTLADGTLVYGSNDRLVVARAKDGAVTPEEPIKIEIATAASDLGGRIALVWTTLDKLHKAILVRPGGEDTFELPGRFQGAPCLTNDRVWIMGGDAELFAFGGGRPLARMPVAAGSNLVGCTAEAAVLRNRDVRREVAICTDECRTATIPSGAPELAAITVVAGKLRAIAAHAGVVGVWSEDKPPVFYALPKPATPLLANEWPAMAMSDDKVIDALAHAGGAVVVIRIPAR